MDSDAAPQRLTLLGEATFNNGLWNPFEIDMVVESGTWKMKWIRTLPVHWKVRS